MPFPILFEYSVWVALVLRLAVGLIFLMHGRPKLFGGLSGFSGFLKQSGFPVPRFFATVAAAGEFFGGILLILGLWTQIAALFFVVQMLVILSLQIFKWKKPLVGGYELDFILFAASLALLLLGGGLYSFDQYFLR